MQNKKIGFWSSTALVTGNMIGSGVFLLPASLAAYGSISIAGWFFSSIGAILLAKVFGHLVKLTPNSEGGPYAYTRAAFGDKTGFLVAWGYWISIWCTNAAIAVAFVGYLKVFFPILEANQFLAILSALSAIWFFTWLNSKPLKTVAVFQLLSTILKVVPLLLVGFIGIFYMQTDYFHPLNSSGESDFSAITTTMTLTLFAYLGMESATIPAKQIENASSVVNRATLTGTVLTIVVYTLSSVAVMGLIPPYDLAHSNSPFADAAALFWGSSARYFVAAGAVISSLGALNGWILIQGQIPMAVAHDRLFPKIFGEVNTHNSPIKGIVLSSILASVLICLNYTRGLVDTFTFMMKLSTLSVLLPFLLSTMGLAVLTRNKEGYLSRWKLFLCLTTLLFCLWAIIGCGLETIFWGAILLIFGIPVYFIIQKNIPKTNEKI